MNIGLIDVIEELKHCKSWACDEYGHRQIPENVENALGMAINALETITKPQPGDLIRREDAIKAVTIAALDDRDELEALEALPSAVCDDCIWHVCNYNKAVDELPSAETHEIHTETHGVCSDLISREAAIEALDEDVMGGLNYERILQSLPSAEANSDDIIIKGAKGIQDGLYNIKDGKLFKYKANGGTVRTYPIVPSAEAVQVDAISKRFISDAILQKISELNAQGEKAIPIAREFIRFKRFVDGLTPIRTDAGQGDGIPIELKKRYPHSRDEDITDAFMRGYQAHGEAVQGVGRYENAMQKLREMPRYLNGVKAKQIKEIPSEAVQGWIPCSERLPKAEDMYQPPEQRYLCQLEAYGERKFCVLSRLKGAISPFWDWYGVAVHDSEVTAWMPLPTPYKCGDDTTGESL